MMISSVTAESLRSVQSPCLPRTHAAAKTQKHKRWSHKCPASTDSTLHPKPHKHAIWRHQTETSPCRGVFICTSVTLQMQLVSRPAGRELSVTSQKGCSSVLILFLITCRGMFYAILLPPEWGRMLSKVLFNGETTFKNLKKRFFCSRDCFRVRCVSLWDIQWEHYTTIKEKKTFCIFYWSPGSTRTILERGEESE